MKDLFQKIKNILLKCKINQTGFTAIQTAIGVSASVIAAGSVATVVVSAGDEGSAEIQQAIHQSLENMSNTFMLKSNLIGKASTTGAHGTLGQIVFNVGLVLNDGQMDFTPPSADPSNNGMAGLNSANSIVISYIDANQRVDNLYWTVTPLGKNDGDYFLEGGEIFQITVGSPVVGQGGGNLIDVLNPRLSTNTNFQLELLHAQTPGLTIQEKTPSSFTKVVTLK